MCSSKSVVSSFTEEKKVCYTMLFFLFIAVSVGASIANDFPCITPNDERAYCISLFSCPNMIKLIGRLDDPTAIDFVKKSVCGDCSGGDIKVCCGTIGNFSVQNNVPSASRPQVDTTPNITTASSPSKTNTTQESHRDFVIRKLLPTRKYCGLQHTDDRFYNESETALDEFPWLVHVGWYNNGDDHGYTERCNGVLISNRYVLTDWLCGFDAKRVKLGQYNIVQNVSCIQDPDYPECTDPTTVIDVEEKFRWAPRSKSGSFNFVLMRLAKTVTYTDYVRPICLPIDDSVRAQQQESLVFSGWGAPSPEGIVKKRLTYKVTGVDVCYKANQYLEGNIISAKADLVCLAAQKNDTILACNGDYGGPLMYSYRNQWFARGLLITVEMDQGSNYCSNELPVNGMGITPEIIEWILSSMHA